MHVSEHPDKAASGHKELECAQVQFNSLMTQTGDEALSEPGSLVAGGAHQSPTNGPARTHEQKARDEARANENRTEDLHAAIKHPAEIERCPEVQDISFQETSQKPMLENDATPTDPPNQVRSTFNHRWPAYLDVTLCSWWTL